MIAHRLHRRAFAPLLVFALWLPGPVAAAAKVAPAVASLQDAMAWLQPRLAASRQRESEALDRVVAQTAFEQLARARLAQLVERHAGTLSAGVRLRLRLAEVDAAHDAADAETAALAPVIERGLVALSASEHGAVTSHRAARLRALVGSMVTPYTENVTTLRASLAEEQTLGWRQVDTDEDLEKATRDIRGLDAGIRQLRERRLEAMREHAAASARRSALVSHLANLVGREGLAARTSTLAVDGTSRLAAGASMPLPQLGLDRPVLQASARATLHRAADAPALVSLTVPRRAPPPSMLGYGLQSPIAGRMEPADPSEANIYRHGRLIETSVTQTVSAPCGGTVVFADTFKGFGPLLIIDRGDGYHALLAGLTRLDVERGGRVVAGQAVGLIGPADGPARLYIELRRHGIPVDPAAWLAFREHRIRS